jgi:hypothetical protein
MFPFLGDFRLRFDSGVSCMVVSQVLGRNKTLVIEVQAVEH